jgi:hypothetical protein
LDTAISILEGLQKNRGILITLEAELVKSTTVPKLLSRVDKLLSLINQASFHGLGAEAIVVETITHIQSIQALILMRNRIRIAVELCSEKEMNKAMNEREKLLKVYGSDLCAEEAEAVSNMRKMICFERLASQQTFVTDAGVDEEVTSNEDQPDIKLPMFVCKQLELMKSSTSQSQLDEETKRFATLVPDACTRRGYIRAFKWVVAFAFWKFPKEDQK